MLTDCATDTVVGIPIQKKLFHFLLFGVLNLEYSSENVKWEKVKRIDNHDIQDYFNAVVVCSLELEVYEVFRLQISELPQTLLKF